MKIKKYMLFFFMAGFLGLILSACDDPGGCDTPKTIPLTQEDTGQTIAMNLADTIKVVLPSNPATGYQWVNLVAEGNIINQAGDAVYEPDPDCAGMPGCGGTETFYFEALEPGTGTIKLVYMQTWMNDPLKEFEVTVVVN